MPRALPYPGGFLMRFRPVLALAAVGALAVALAPPATAATAVATWQMNESAGARVMTDSSGHGLSGSIGSEVQTGVNVAGAKGYRFLESGRDNQNPRRLVTVADRSSLDPGTKTYAITWRMRTTKPYGNVIQKGQSATSGGYFKVQAPNGIVQCLFRGSGGSKAVGSGRALNDGNWHTLRCERTSSGVSLSVDGGTPRVARGATGNISNSFPLSIGGKTSCNQGTVTCDYFVGDIDRVAITAG